MTRYSRSVLPGRAPLERRDEPQDTDGLDRLVFGGKRKPANDAGEPDFLPAMEDDEDSDRMVARANSDRRKGNQERRVVPVADRRQAAGRRSSEYAPLRADGARRVAPDDSKRGPLLLLGALLIVVVFAVVVWNAYRDGLQGDEVEVAPELSTAGSFKTPPRDIAPAPVVVEPTETVSDIPLDGGPSAIEASDEQRPISLTPAKPVEPAAATPAPSKFTATPPPALKPPVTATVPPPQQPAAKPAVVVAKPSVAKPVVAKPVVAAATPAPAATTSGFASYGDHVVQIAATSSEVTANSEWTKMLKTYPDLLTGGEKFIQQADVNGKTVYRLRVGSFASKADAATFCAAFKAKGGNCYPALK
ncbi:MAG: SPOR domain-containing protein [Hyphomonadaceae bacterium]